MGKKGGKAKGQRAKGAAAVFPHLRFERRGGGTPPRLVDASGKELDKKASAEWVEKVNQMFDLDHQLDQAERSACKTLERLGWIREAVSGTLLQESRRKGKRRSWITAAVGWPPQAVQWVRELGSREWANSKVVQLLLKEKAG